MSPRVMRPNLPYDVFLQICGFCSDWKDVISLRAVCRSWNYFFKERSIWVYLVSSFLDQLSSSPKLHHIEQPISSCSAADLERAYKSWRVAEKTWKIATQRKSGVTELQLDVGCLAKASILAPGGRWLIVFTRLVGGLCFDLNSSSPSPMVLIPAQVLCKSQVSPHGTGQVSDESEHQIVVDVSEPEVNTASENLSFRVVLTFGARYRDATVQVWQFDTNFDSDTGQSSLTALKVYSWSPGYGVLRCRSFLGNMIVLEAPDMDVGFGIPTSASKLLIFNWRKAKQNPSHFPLRFLFTYDRPRHAQLLRDGYILLSSYDEGLVLYNYASIPVYTGRRVWERIAYLYPNIKTILSDRVYTFVSRPYYLESSSEESDLEGDIPAGSIILGNLKGQLHEMDIEADIDIVSTSMEPTWYLGDVSMACKDSVKGGSTIQDQGTPLNLQICLGYSHAAGIMQGSLKLISYWRGSRDVGDLIVKDTGITVSDDVRLQMDEGSGRIGICNPTQNYIQIVDLAV